MKNMKANVGFVREYSGFNAGDQRSPAPSWRYSRGSEKAKYEEGLSLLRECIGHLLRARGLTSVGGFLFFTYFSKLLTH